jgi:hypothetical protein
VADDFRVTVQLAGEEHASRLTRALHDHRVGTELRAALGGRVAVSLDGDTVFLYADSEAAARAAQSTVAELLERDSVEASYKLDRWHPVEELWQDVSLPLPASPPATKAEHEKLEGQELAETQASGVAEWELRLEFASHHDAAAFAERLSGEGFTHLVHRWKYLIVGARDEDDAELWAKRLTAELPPGATVHVEPGGGLAWMYQRTSPFAVFGGLAG